MFNEWFTKNIGILIFNKSDIVKLLLSIAYIIF